jgi:diacylglycerol kinase family enzyme
MWLSLQAAMVWWGGVITHVAESGLPLGILPLGTSNDIARALHIPQDIGEAAHIIAHGREQEVDIGMAQPAEQATHPVTPSQFSPVSAQKQAFFAHALTVGVNVQFARIATNVATRKRFGRMTYPYAALKTAAARDALDIRLDFEGLAMPQATVSPQGATSPPLTTPETHTSLRCRGCCHWTWWINRFPSANPLRAGFFVMV